MAEFVLVYRCRHCGKEFNGGEGSFQVVYEEMIKNMGRNNMLGMCAIHACTKTTKIGIGDLIGMRRKSKKEKEE